MINVSTSEVTETELDKKASLTVQLVHGIDRVPSDQWDACAGFDCPFVSHAFLSILEVSGSSVPDEGWIPCHVVVLNKSQEIVGCAPLYAKSHSQGEYVFDHGWAAAFERAGGRYYPKMVCAVPFTPVTGPRILVRPDAAKARVRRAMIAGMIKAARRFSASSVHVNFSDEETWRDLGECGFLQRLGHQFHWINRGYESFEEFLGALSSRKRKNIRKERNSVAKAGVTLHRFSGSTLKLEHWQAFYRFYRNTTDQKWGWDYLKPSFFELLHDRMRDRVVLVLARHDGEWVAGALNFLGKNVIYGRNWGSEGFIRNLHFEACYYQAIEHAIENRLDRVEAGAQGCHKLRRGYLPVPTFSSHWIAHDGLRRAVAEFLDHETLAIRQETDSLMRVSPFRRC